MRPHQYDRGHSSGSHLGLFPSGRPGDDRGLQCGGQCAVYFADLGAGADFIGQAAFKGADVYLTGDVKYHDAQRAVQQNINLVDGGHFPTEFPVVEALAAYLRENMAKAKRPAEIITDTVSRDFFKVI